MHRRPPTQPVNKHLSRLLFALIVFNSTASGHSYKLEDLLFAYHAGITRFQYQLKIDFNLFGLIIA